MLCKNASPIFFRLYSCSHTIRCIETDVITQARTCDVWMSEIEWRSRAIHHIKWECSRWVGRSEKVDSWHDVILNLVWRDTRFRIPCICVRIVRITHAHTLDYTLLPGSMTRRSFHKYTEIRRSSFWGRHTESLKHSKNTYTHTLTHEWSSLKIAPVMSTLIQ